MNPRSLFEGAPPDGRAIEETLDDLPVNLVVRSCQLWCNLDVGGGGLEQPVANRAKHTRLSSDENSCVSEVGGKKYSRLLGQ